MGKLLSKNENVCIEQIYSDIQKLRCMRDKAFEMLKSNKSKFNIVEKQKIVSIINSYIENNNIPNSSFIGVVHQMHRDIILYKKYDCLAMWLDDESGLAKYEQMLIKEISIKVGEL